MTFAVTFAEGKIEVVALTEAVIEGDIDAEMFADEVTDGAMVALAEVVADGSVVVMVTGSQEGKALEL